MIVFRGSASGVQKKPQNLISLNLSLHVRAGAGIAGFKTSQNRNKHVIDLHFLISSKGKRFVEAFWRKEHKHSALIII